MHKLIWVGNPFNANTNLFAPVVELLPLDFVRLATIVDLRFGAYVRGITSGTLDTQQVPPPICVLQACARPD